MRAKEHETEHGFDTLWCVVLAAGGSSRLGRPKQLVRRNGRTLIARVAGQARSLVGRRVVVVVGAEAARVRAALRGSGCSVVSNPRWREGLASSLRVGLAALPRRARAALILLSDQPRVPGRALERMVTRWKQAPHRAVAAAYSQRLGVPAILPRRAWREAAGLEGDVGARALLAAMANVISVELPEAAYDIDTPADLGQL
jgi:molybdenum cofactor cytidylyltransferase